MKTKIGIGLLVCALAAVPRGAEARRPPGPQLADMTADQLCVMQRQALESDKRYLAISNNSPSMQYSVGETQKQLDGCLAAAQVRIDAAIKKRAAEREIAETAARQEEAPRPEVTPETPSEIRQRLSATLCYASAERTKFKAQIDEQKRGARIGGVVDKGKLYEAQQEIVAMDMLSDSIKRSLKAARSKPADCRKLDRAKFDAFLTCVGQQRNDTEDDSAAESVDQVMSAGVACAAGEGL